MYMALKFYPIDTFMFLISSFCFWMVFIICVARFSFNIKCEWKLHCHMQCVPGRRNSKCKAWKQEQTADSRSKVRFQILFLQPCYFITSGEDAGGKARWCCHFGKQLGRFLQLAMHSPYDPPIPLLVIYLRGKKTGSHKFCF